MIALIALDDFGLDPVSSFTDENGNTVNIYQLPGNVSVALFGNYNAGGVSYGDPSEFGSAFFNPPVVYIDGELQ